MVYTNFLHQFKRNSAPCVKNKTEKEAIMVNIGMVTNGEFKPLGLSPRSAFWQIHSYLKIETLALFALVAKVTEVLEAPK